ncbi:MAG: sigma-70 family RNA polymerase sigma factor [Acidobacteriota bacterium]|nr:sigma-70 family RNA polymerase sigma factor [Acidobacteriota bacterium]
MEGNSEEWIRCCSRRFFPLARRIVGDDDLAEDALQISWIKILQTARACRSGSQACPWVRTIVTNAAKDVRRRNHCLREDALSEEVEDSSRNPENLAQEEEIHCLLREMIVLLPETYRQVVDLRFYRGLSTRQTAERLDISPSNAGVRLSRAVEMLMRRLDSRLSAR